jgi:serine/threonine protein kinase
VKLCYDTILKRQVAMKIMNKNRLKTHFIDKTTTAYKLLENEIAVMKKMNHPNIVQLYEIIDDPTYNKLCLVMKYISGGTLADLVKAKGALPIDLSLKYFRELIAGLDYCHDIAQIIHRDIKPENLLIDTNNNLQIVDFGVSFFIENGRDQAKATFGSAYFAAPEICQGLQYKGRQTDVWASGVTLYYMLMAKFPFNGINMKSIYSAIINDK